MAAVEVQFKGETTVVTPEEASAAVLKFLTFLYQLLSFQGSQAYETNCRELSWTFSNKGCCDSSCLL